MPERRAKPEAFLQRALEEEQKAKRGKLKIYLGAAPGVGKTYNMLNDALAKRAQGLDVVVGIVETHGRHEIKFLLDDLEILPRQEVIYRDQKLTEFNLDAALKRNPALILIDEMAHTNVPGTRHTKRWRDIKEILDRGIDVYTTLNVQHVESLNDVVSGIIHTRVKETVPDSMLELADTIELVDLPADDLIKRLQEGKVYYPKTAELAAENFFRKGNLIALRELALRLTAERVGAEVIHYRKGQGIRRIWQTREKLLVCIGSNPESVKLIRTARRLATKFQAEWIAIHVDTPKIKLSEKERNAAVQYLHLAEQLGAETRILTGFDLVKEIMDFAREQNVTQLIISQRKRPRWKSFLFRGLADELVRASEEIDVYIVTMDESARPKPEKHEPEKKKVPWRLYGIALAIVGVTSVLNYILSPHIHPSNFIMIYLLGVTIVALMGRMGPSIFASIASVLAYDFFFMRSFLSFPESGIQYFVTLMVMLIVAYIISHLTILIRRQAEAAHAIEKRTAILHSLSRRLATTRGVENVLDIGERFINEVFDSDVIVFLPQNQSLVIHRKKDQKLNLDPKEQGVAQWVYDLGQIAGLGTDTLPFSDALYVPMLASHGSIGVMRVKPVKHMHLFSPEQIHLLEACVNQIALAIEVDNIEEYTKEHEIKMEAEHVRNALLQSVSHDLRMPLVGVIGAASALIEAKGDLDRDTIKKLGSHIYMEIEQLNRLINNILQTTYLDAETIVLQKECHSLREVVDRVIKRNKKFESKTICIAIPDDLPEVPFDETLLYEVFVNLIDNAITFSPENAPIEITATSDNANVVISILDRGAGIAPDEVDKLFDKFYRGRSEGKEKGLGLGLAICKSVVIAHGGKIWMENRTGGGAIFRFTLPLS